MIENEGPRPLFRRKVARKLAGWTGSPLTGRIGIFSEPWGEFTFADESWRAALAAKVREEEIDVLIAGPVTRLGMNEAGTLQQVRDFMELVKAVRVESGRRLAVILVHHENKGGAVSGAWEGAADTLLHVEARGPGHTRLHVQKARWSSDHHGTHLDLAWAEGEGFTLEEAIDRDYTAEIAALLADGKWRTLTEIANKRDHKEQPGIGAGKDTVRDTLKGRPDLFTERRGTDVGRSATATVYGLASAQKPVEPVTDPQRTGDATGLLACPIGKPVGTGPVPPPQLALAWEQTPVDEDGSIAKQQAKDIEGAVTAGREAQRLPSAIVIEP
jgi:hypothetical protein